MEEGESRIKHAGRRVALDVWVEMISVIMALDVAGTESSTYWWIVVSIFGQEVAVRTRLGTSTLKPGKVGFQRFSCWCLSLKLYVSKFVLQCILRCTLRWLRRKKQLSCFTSKKCLFRHFICSSDIRPCSMGDVVGVAVTVHANIHTSFLWAKK